MMKKDKNSLITAQTVETVSVIYQSNGIWQFYVYSCTLGVLKSALFFELLYSTSYFVDIFKDGTTENAKCFNLFDAQSPNNVEYHIDLQNGFKLSYL